MSSGSERFTRRTALRRFAVSGAGVTFGAGVLAGCGSSGGGSGSSKEPVRVGVLTDLTGAFGIVGKSNKAVAQFAANEINASGGVLGRKIELVVVDSASDPATAAKVASKLVTSNNVDMVIGGVTSATRQAIKGIIASRGRTLYLWPASYEGGECDENVWNTGAVPVQQVNPTVDYLLKKGAKTFYLCGNDYIYPRNVLGAARQRIEAGGGRVIGEQYIPVNATDAPDLVTKVLAADADALFEVVILPATVPFIRGVVDGGYKGMIASSLLDQTDISLIGKDSQGLICAQDFYPSIKDPFSQKELRKFHQQFPNGNFSSVLNSAAWYRGFHLWKLAAEKAGSVDTAKVNKAMDGIGSDKLIGGPARFVPGTRHCELTMYLGELEPAKNTVKVVSDLGQIPPTGQCG